MSARTSWTWLLSVAVLLSGCGPVPTDGTTPAAGGEGGGTCDDACTHYVQCKGSADQELYTGCVTQCQGAAADAETLAAYASLDCPTAVAMVDGEGGMGAAGTPTDGAGGGNLEGPVASSGKTTLEDTWLYADHKMRYAVVFNADGTMTLNNIAAKYKKDGTKITITAANGVSTTYEFALDGDALTVSGGDLPAAVTLGRNGTQRGVIAQMAGIYESYESHTDPSMHMSHTQYVTLYPDGSVGWAKAEGGASRTAINENWERFRSWKESGKQFADAGTWVSNGTTIRIQWRYWGGKLSQGQVDLASGKFSLSGMGVLNEGATLEFKRN